MSYEIKVITGRNHGMRGVAPEIGVPIAEKLAYVSDDSLSEMYINLLTKASSSDTVSQAHPSFVNVINNLSPDEAQLLELFVIDGIIPFLTARLVDTTRDDDIISDEMLFSPERITALDFPLNVSAYMSNLVGLGLVHVDKFTLPYADEYNNIETHWKENMPGLSTRFPGRELLFDRCTVSKTPYGNLFIDACHKS